jgi:hypothetical protein
MPNSELPPVEEDVPPKALAEKYPNPKELVKAIHEGKAGAIPSMIEIMQAFRNSAGWKVQPLHAAICSARDSIDELTKHSADMLRNPGRRDIRAKWCSTAEGDNFRLLQDRDYHPDPDLAGVYKLLFFDMLKDMMILKAKSSSFDLNSRIGIKSKPYKPGMNAL